MTQTEIVVSHDRGANQEVPATLSDRLDGWEQDLRGGCEEANATVNETVQGVATLVSDSAQGIEEAVQDTARALDKAIDIERHFRRHPWLTVGVALVLGLVVVQWISRRD